MWQKPFLQAFPVRPSLINAMEAMCKTDTSLVGSLETLRQRIAALEVAGIYELIIDFPNATNLTPLYRFAQEFIAKHGPSCSQ